MISRLRGLPVAMTADGLVLDVGGVGYLVASTPAVLRRAEGAAEITIETYLHVREDTLQLYGFADAGERELFGQLLTVNGIGPKVALAVVCGSPAAALRRAFPLCAAAPLLRAAGRREQTAERGGADPAARPRLRARGPASRATAWH